MTCGLRYHFRYVKGIISPPSVALVFGSSGHKALEKNFFQKIETKIDLPTQQILDEFSDQFDVKSVEVEDWEGQRPGIIKDKGIRAISLHQREIAPGLQPVEDGVERELSLAVDGVEMLGYTDLITEKSVIDHKFVGKVRSQGQADNDLQLSYYSYATGKKDVGLNCIIKPTPRYPEGKVRMVTSRRTKKDLEWMEFTIRSVAENISKGVFTPALPDSWACCSRFCGYWDMCRGGKNYLALGSVEGREDENVAEPKSLVDILDG